MRFLVILCATALFLSALAISPLRAQDEAVESKPRPAKVFTVKTSASEVRRVYPAVVLPSTEVDLSFRVSGRVIELPVRGAMQVKQGDLIAALDPSDFEAQVAQLESQIQQSDAQLIALKSGARAEEIASLEANVASAEAQLDRALDQAERTRELVERGVSTTAQLEQVEADLRVARANLTAQQEQLQIGRSGGRPEDILASEAAIRGLQAQLKVAKDNLSYTRLEAPFAGVIARRDIDNFTNIQAGQSVALLQALAVVHLAFDVPGPDVTALTRAGADSIRNQVIFDAIPDRVIDGEVVEFALQADSATQTYRARVAVAVEREAVILPGMVGRVISTAPGQGSTMTIPLSAIAAGSGGETFVFIVGSDNTVTRRDVTLGEATGDHVAVREGLSDGDVIVSAGVSRLLEGQEIRPFTKIGG